MGKPSEGTPIALHKLKRSDFHVGQITTCIIWILTGRYRMFSWISIQKISRTQEPCATVHREDFPTRHHELDHTDLGEIIRQSQISPQVPCRISSEVTRTVVADLCFNVSTGERKPGETTWVVGKGQTGSYIALQEATQTRGNNRAGYSRVVAHYRYISRKYIAMPTATCKLGCSTPPLPPPTPPTVPPPSLRSGHIIVERGRHEGN